VAIVAERLDATVTGKKTTPPMVRYQWTQSYMEISG
jgi:hypothetical protein